MKRKPGTQAGSGSQEGRRKAKKKKKAVGELPESPPSADSSSKSESDAPEPKSKKVGSSDVGFEQRLSRHFFSLSEQVMDLRRDLQALQGEVLQLKAQDKLDQDKDKEKVASIELSLMTAFKPLSAIVDSWMLQMKSEGILPTDDKALRPCFQTKLPFHYAFPFLNTETDVEEPLRKEIFKQVGVKLSEASKRAFHRLYLERKVKNTESFEGFFQKYMRLRRQVKNDKIGKPVLQFAETNSITRLEKPCGWRTTGTQNDQTCFFFKTKGCRELFCDIFSNKLAGIASDRTVLSVIQLAILDNAVLSKSRQVGNKDKTEKMEMSNVANGARGTISNIAAGIATEVWDYCVNCRETSDSSLQQPCDCCWLVDVSPSPGSPIREMIEKFEDGKKNAEVHNVDSQSGESTGRTGKDTAKANAEEKRDSEDEIEERDQMDDEDNGDVLNGESNADDDSSSDSVDQNSRNREKKRKTHKTRNRV